ncbi:hypothetical protein C8R44DRAFT_858718 [Mycena epipterygia]|nr:hypothetical protein C8R44DRAFT_858718 [Mycena epipterygia]
MPASVQCVLGLRICLAFGPGVPKIQRETVPFATHAHRFLRALHPPTPSACSSSRTSTGRNPHLQACDIGEDITECDAPRPSFTAVDSLCDVQSEKVVEAGKEGEVESANAKAEEPYRPHRPHHPSMRHFARPHGVDLVLLEPIRRVERADVEVFISASATPSSASTSTSTSTSMPAYGSTYPSAPPPVKRSKRTRTRRLPGPHATRGVARDGQGILSVGFFNYEGAIANLATQADGADGDSAGPWTRRTAGGNWRHVSRVVQKYETTTALPDQPTTCYWKRGALRNIHPIHLGM